MAIILSNDELIASGISLSNLQKSLTLTYQGKEFERNSDIPKQFKDKAFKIYHSIINTGKKSFISESTYSYTIWEEKQTTTHNNKIKPHLSFYVDSGNSEAKPLQSLSPSSLPNPQLNRKKTRKTKEVPQMKVYIRKADNTDENTASELEINSEELRKYRGVPMDNSNQDINYISNATFTSSSNQEAVRKYRGAIIDDESNNTPVSKVTPTSKPKKIVRKYRGVIIEE